MTAFAPFNYSRVEDFFAPFEDAKTFATLMLLSDCPVDREQAIGANFLGFSIPIAFAEAHLASLAANRGSIARSWCEARGRKTLSQFDPARSLCGTMRNSPSS
ncbi:MAG: hypothetical protein GW854_13615 [Erythrobacter sp.]|nr:hypothetical protein [Erythrobacter sp.]